MNSSTTPKVQKKPVKGLTFDIPFVLALVCLLALGLMMVYSTDLDASLRM